MKTLLLASIFALPLLAQEDRPVRYFPNDPVNPCSVITPLVNNWATGRLWDCVGLGGSNNGTWQLLTQGSSNSSIQYLPATYNFPSQPGSGSLTGGSPATITFAPVPLGVNATDPGHSIYISGGTGTAEACLITGGTAVAGTPSGTITCTPANNHTGAWRVSSATGGISEAQQAAFSAGGGTVNIPSGVITLHAYILPNTKVCLSGQGIGSTVLRVAAGEFSNIPPWRFGANPSAVVIGSGTGTSKLCITGLTLDLQGSTQTSAPAGSVGIDFINVSQSLISNVQILNGPILTAGNTYLGIILGGTSANNIIDGTFINNQVCNITSEGAGGIIVAGSGNRVTNNYVGNGCNAPYASIGIDNVFIGNTFELLGSTQVAASQAFSSDNGTNTSFIGNTCIGNNTGPACFSATTDNGSPAASNTVFIGNIARNCGQAFQISPQAAPVTGVTIQGNSIQNCAVPFIITGGAGNTDVSISGTPGLLNGMAPFFPITSSAINHDIAILDNQTIRLFSASGAFSLGGFVGGWDQRTLTVINATGQAMTIKQADSGSTSGNRILTLTGSDMLLTARTASFIYSAQDGFWIMTQGQ